MTDKMPEEWALKEICRRTGESYDHFRSGKLSSGVANVIRVAAAILEQHEEPPVDPLLIEAREMAAEDHRSGRDSFMHDGVMLKYGAGESLILGGKRDHIIPIPDYMRALRRGIELGRKEQ